MATTGDIGIESGAAASEESGKKVATTNALKAKKTKMTESESVPASFEELQASLKAKADEVVTIGLPSKILRVHRLIESAAELKILGPTDSSVEGEIMRAVASATTESERKENSEPRKLQLQPKKRKLVDGSSAECCDKESGSKMIAVSSNKSLQRIMEILKEELLDGLSMLSTLKTWIQLNVPRIEDGDNFGVAVQEECAGEIGRVEDSGFAVLESMTKYFTTRARMVEKMLKHPEIIDYRHAVLEADYIQHATVRTYLMDVRNNFMVLHDLLTKNLEKLRKPRSMRAHMSSMY